jgi:hypothetical protein
MDSRKRAAEERGNDEDGNQPPSKKRYKELAPLDIVECKGCKRLMMAEAFGDHVHRHCHHYRLSLLPGLFQEFHKRATDEERAKMQIECPYPPEDVLLNYVKEKYEGVSATSTTDKEAALDHAGYKYLCAYFKEPNSRKGDPCSCRSSSHV